MISRQGDKKVPIQCGVVWMVITANAPDSRLGYQSVDLTFLSVLSTIPSLHLSNSFRTSLQDR